MENKSLSFWFKILKTTLKMPGAIVNREDFLRAEFAKKCTAEELDKIVAENPKAAGVSDAFIRKSAQRLIRLSVAETGGLSFAAGLPGGLFIAATIPADLAQFYLHEIILIQKLAYLYGKPEIISKDTRKEEHNLLHLTLYFGVAYGADDAEDALWEFEHSSIMPDIRKPFEQEAVTQIALQIGKWLGVRIVKGLTKNGTAKLIPLAGGFVSGGLSAVTLSKSAKRLHNHLISGILEEK